MPPDFPEPNIQHLFHRNPPVVAGDGLRRAMGRLFAGLVPETSEPEIKRSVPEQPAAAAAFTGCWAPSAIDATTIKLTPGTLTCGTIFTPDVSGVTVDATALTHIYLRVTLSPTHVDGFTSGGSATAVDVIGSTSDLASDNTYGYVLLCDWQAGAVVARYEFFSLYASLQNAGVGDVLFVYWPS